LRQRKSSPLFDFAQSQRAIGAHTRENNADAMLLLILRQGSEEKINWQTLSALRQGFKQM
jgi:hypothetical protein